MRVLREQVEVLRDAMRRRGSDNGVLELVDRGETLERDRRTLIQAVEERKAARNTNAQEVARRKKAKESADDLIGRGRELSANGSNSRARASSYRYSALTAGLEGAAAARR